MEFCYANNPNSLFRKYARLVTWFANTGIGRDYLSHHLPKIPRRTALMLPNGFIEPGGGGTYRATFFSRSVYSPKLYPALAKLDLISQWLKDFQEAKRLLAWELGLTRNMPALAKAMMFATLTVYPDPDPEITSVDGTIWRNPGTPGESWATIREAASGTVAYDNTNINAQLGYLATDANNAAWANLVRAIFLFDTSSLGAGSTIDSATCSFYGTDKRNTVDLGNVGLVSSNPASNTALAIGDYSSLGTTRFASDITYASYSTTTYNDFALNSTGLNNISKTGITKFGTRFSKDIDNIEPAKPGAGLDGYYLTNMAEVAGTSQDPKLVVTYTPLTQTLAETITLVDSLVKRTDKALPETITLTDSLTKSVSKLLADTISLADSLAGQIGRTLTETLTFADNLWTSFKRGVASWTKQTPTSTNWEKER